MGMEWGEGRWNKTGGRKIVNRVEGSSGLNSGLSSGNREKEDG